MIKAKQDQDHIVLFKMDVFIKKYPFPKKCVGSLWESPPQKESICTQIQKLILWERFDYSALPYTQVK